MYEPCTLYCSRFLHLLVEVQRVASVRSSCIGYAVRLHYCRDVFGTLLLTQNRCGSRNSSKRCRAGTLITRVHIAFIIVTDIDKIGSSLDGATQ